MRNARVSSCKAIVAGCLSLVLVSTGGLGCLNKTALALEEASTEEAQSLDAPPEGTYDDQVDATVPGIEVEDEGPSIELVPDDAPLDGRESERLTQQGTIESSSIVLIEDDSNAEEPHAEEESTDVIDRVEPWEGADYRERVGKSTSESVALPDGRWVEFEDGSKGYMRNDELVYGWADIAGAEYYFDEAGHMLTGWQSLTSAQGLTRDVYLRSSGSVATGWCEVDGQMYYFKPDGSMVRGWLTIVDDATGEERHYYLSESGTMLTGWQDVDGARLYFRASGSLAIGWADVEGVGKCFFDQFGSMVAGWQTINERTYHFTDNGAMQTGMVEVDNSSYVFSDKGVLVI